MWITLRRTYSLDMLAKVIILVFYCYYCLIENVFCQVCVNTQMYWHDVPETYLYTYMEAYEESDCLFWCTGTRVATAVGTRIVQKQVAEEIAVCCDGYVEEPSNTSNSLHCKPVCSPPCVNGYCKSPYVCACDSGYLPNMFESHSCDPLCLKGCEHGTCEAPNTCVCETGYENVDEICKPICFEPCDNGTCIAPNTCQCLPGYKKSDNDTCEPYCASYTASGECINTITCESGWEKVTKGSLEICQPVCTETCVNSICVAPETCECFNGYVKSMLGTCEPYCSSGCPQGRCISPEICVCDPGWFIKESSGACAAHCDHPCGNGTCVAPNVCECFTGFIFDESKLLEGHGSLCVPVCENCDEPCVDPENCTCPWPQMAMRTTAAGEPCDCLDCSDLVDKCKRTICFMTTTTMTTPDKVSIIIDTDLTESVLSTTEIVEDETTAHSNSINYFELQINKASWLHSKWVYGIGSVLLVSILIAVVAAIVKRSLSNETYLVLMVMTYLLLSIISRHLCRRFIDC